MMNQEDQAYKKLFERNYGVYTSEEQERIRNANILIIGTGGIGGVIAITLARSGVEHFTIYEFDSYQPSNINRQICCFSETVGKNKGVVTRDTILSINPAAEVELIERELLGEEIPSVIREQKWDVVMPAADKWPLSISLLDTCVEFGVPAVMSYPAGALGRVCTFMPGGPFASECLVMPYKASYDQLKEFMESPENRSILHYYKKTGGWTQEWFDGFCEGKLPHPQITPIVWITGALAAMEIIKIVTRRWKPVAAPKYWHITPDGGRIARFGLGRRLLSRIIRRDWGKKIIPALVKRPRLVRIFTRLIS